MLPVQRARKRSTTISVQIGDGWEVFGQHEDRMDKKKRTGLRAPLMASYRTLPPGELQLSSDWGILRTDAPQIALIFLGFNSSEGALLGEITT